MSEIGVNDFGAGKAMVVASMCQRFAKLPRACDICIRGCPTDALEPREHTLFTSDSCLKCGACLSMCPMSALGVTRQTIQETTRKLLDATLTSRCLLLTCQRTRYLAHKASRAKDAEDEEAGGGGGAVGAEFAGGGGTAGGFAAGAKTAPPTEAELLDAAEADGLLYTVACLAMLSAPIWFALLNEREITPLEELGVLLPPGQCADCPVNAKGTIEALLDEAVNSAEVWTDALIKLYGSAADLPPKANESLLRFLRAPAEADRREALTGVFHGLKGAWEELARRDNQALLEVRLKRLRREAHKHTLLGKSLSEQPSLSTTPRAIVVPSRYQLIDALGRNPAHASDVRINVSGTNDALCNLCGRCVDACALHARRIAKTSETDRAKRVNAAAANAAAAVETNAAADTAAAAEINATTDTATTTEADTASDVAAAEVNTAAETDAAAGTGPKVICEELYCVGCGACREVCETGACHLLTISGEGFLWRQSS
jgi:ferredoxin